MSFAPFAPNHLGYIIPIDQATGALLTPVWAADDVSSVVVTDARDIVTHPLQGGGIGPTDAVVEHPTELSVSCSVRNIVSGTIALAHPRRDWIGSSRAMRAAQELRQLADAGQPVALLLRGFDLLRGYVIGNLTITPSGDFAQIDITYNAREVRIVSLTTVEVEQDADLVALGSQAIISQSMQ